MRRTKINYFTTLLSSQAHSLYLPRDSKEEIERLVRQHKSEHTTPEHTPFQRQLNFWVLAIASAIALDLPPLEESPSKWGVRFIDTTKVRMPDEICALLAVISFAKLGPEHEGIDNPKQIVDLGNRLAGAGCPELLKAVNDPSLKLTPLDKALEFAKALYKKQENSEA